MSSRLAPVLTSIEVIWTAASLYVAVDAPPLDVIVQGTLGLTCNARLK